MESHQEKGQLYSGRLHNFHNIMRRGQIQIQRHRHIIRLSQCQWFLVLKTSYCFRLSHPNYSICPNSSQSSSRLWANILVLVRIVLSEINLTDKGAHHSVVLVQDSVKRISKFTKAGGDKGLAVTCAGCFFFWTFFKFLFDWSGFKTFFWLCGMKQCKLGS